MTVRQIIRTALKAMRRNPMRAMLTTLGIVIGIGAVITMMEIGNGSSAAMQKTISSMGASTLLVMPGTAVGGPVSMGAGSVMTLTPGDCQAILTDCPSVRAAAPLVRARTQVIYGSRNWQPSSILGTTPDYLNVREWTDLAEGDPFTDRDVLNGSRVCLLGQTVVRELFQGESPVGQEIRVKSVTFRVIGVLSRKGASMMGSDQDDVLLAPWTTIKQRVAGSTLATVNQSSSSADASSGGTTGKIYPGTPPALYPEQSAVQAADNPLPVRFTNVDQIMASAYTAKMSQAAIGEITELLRERHRLQDNEPEDFTIRDMTEIATALSSTTLLMTNLLLVVAAISLVVGGVGIMNIMLVSVTERTREIGLRMAVGARARDILRQFLLEAVVLCMIGGILGITLGRGASLLVAYYLNWPVESAPEAIVAAVAVSMTVGVVFGWYPAWKASRLDPIEALRYE